VIYDRRARHVVDLPAALVAGPVQVGFMRHLYLRLDLLI
jgi:hypothetical protein